MPTLEELRKMLERKDEPEKPQGERSMLEVVAERMENAFEPPTFRSFRSMKVTMTMDSSPVEIDVPNGPQVSLASALASDGPPPMPSFTRIRTGMNFLEVARVAKRIYKTAYDRMYDNSLVREDVGLLAIEEDTGDVYQLEGLGPQRIEHMETGGGRRPVFQREPIGVWKAVGTFGMRVDTSSFR